MRWTDGIRQKEECNEEKEECFSSQYVFRFLRGESEKNGCEKQSAQEGRRGARPAWKRLSWRVQPVTRHA